MVSGWWLLATFWIGGCLGIMLAMLLQVVRDDDAEKQFASQAREPSPVDRRSTAR